MVHFQLLVYTILYARAFLLSLVCLAEILYAVFKAAHCEVFDKSVELLEFLSLVSSLQVKVKVFKSGHN